MKAKLSLVLFLSSFLACSSAFAAILTIKNDSTSNLEVVVEPGDGTIFSSDYQIKRIVKPSETVTIKDITPDKLGNVDTFSVLGRVTMPSINNRCKDLEFNKNYSIVFVPTSMKGVEYRCKELNDGHVEKDASKTSSNKDNEKNKKVDEAIATSSDAIQSDDKE